MESNTTPINTSFNPEDLLLMIMNPDDLRDLAVTSVTTILDGEKKMRGTDISFNELVGVMALAHRTAQSNGVVRRFNQDRQKNKRKLCIDYYS